MSWCLKTSGSPKCLNRRLLLTAAGQGQTTANSSAGVVHIDQARCLPAGGAESLQAEEDAARLKTGNQRISQGNEVKLIRLRMEVALNRCGDRAKGQRSAEVDHLAHRRHLGDVQRDIDGGVAIKRLKCAAPLSGQRFRQLCSACDWIETCLLYTSPSPRDRQKSRMPSSA